MTVATNRAVLFTNRFVGMLVAAAFVRSFVDALLFVNVIHGMRRAAHR